MTKTEWNFHPDRDSLIAEAHARPSQNVSAPAQILQIAFRCSGNIRQKFFNTVANGEDATNLRHVSGDIQGIRIKLEQHTEFMSCMLLRDMNKSDAIVSLADVFHQNFPTSEIETLVLLQIDVVTTTNQMLKLLPPTERIYGGKIRNQIDVRSTFKPDENGAVQFVVHGKKLTGDELGRRLQRLVEMETYRTMSLLGLSKARAVGSQLTEYEDALDNLTRSLRDENATSNTDDEKLFEALSALSEKNNILASEIRYRFAASRAYYALFDQRITSLEEEKVGDVQTMSGFLRSRLEPAIATIESTAKRQETLTNDLSRALTLLRTRIELNLNKGNQALLQSMDRRHDQQLKISRTVEGLSVVAITYYAVGLVSYLLKALAKQPWMPLSETILTAISVPFILVIVWFSLHRIRSAWEDHRKK
ncbi:MAG: DUF3422 domain-containing protein [Rhizobiaceae bacterium]|nr:DUF3422 domain-containing protein [Rhizobiaceae bacterium]